jgi:hypothetical protein
VKRNRIALDPRVQLQKLGVFVIILPGGSRTPVAEVALHVAHAALDQIRQHGTHPAGLRLYG